MKAIDFTKYPKVLPYVENFEKFNLINENSNNQIEEGDDVMYKGTRFYVSKITSEIVRGFRDTKWHLSSYKVGVEDTIIDSYKTLKKLSKKSQSYE